MLNFRKPEAHRPVQVYADNRMVKGKSFSSQEVLLTVKETDNVYRAVGIKMAAMRPFNKASTHRATRCRI